MRRSFKSNALYAAVFGEYVQELIAQGFPLEYFIEGGRSRTGRLLNPRAGMLAMTVCSFLRAPQRPVVFQPVYIGYEKLIEGKSYIGELSGKPKEKESLFGLVRSLGVLREQYGTVTVNFGEPIELNEILGRRAPNWREQGYEEERRPEWLPGVIDELAERIQVAINRAADVNPIALLGLILLGTPKHAIGEDDLLRLLKLYQDYVRAVPYSDRVTLTELGPSEVIAYGESMRWIRRIKHPLGDVLAVAGDEAVLISYFRNNVLHLFVATSWVACCFLNNRRLTPGAVVSLGKAVYPFLKTELFLPWTVEEFGRRIEQTLAWFLAQDLLSEDATGGYYLRPSEGSDAFFALRVLAHGLLQTFQRYYLVVALLNKNGPRTLTAAKLEELCHLTAQRIALLHELAGPEYFDKGLFKNFVQMLRAQKVVWTDEQGRLDYGAELERIGADSKLILSRELRHSIIKLTNESGGPTPPEQPSHTAAA
jgi:glycerol-3-phosphate O-acyltransferase